MAIGSVLLSYFLGKNKEKEDKDYDEARYKERATAALHNQEQMRMDEETRRPAIELAKRQELQNWQDQVNQRNYVDQGMPYWSLAANQLNANNGRQVAAITGGQTDVNSILQAAISRQQLAQGLPKSTARLAAAQNQFGNDYWGGLNQRAVGDTEAGIRAMKGMTDTAYGNEFYSKGGPWIQAQNDLGGLSQANILRQSATDLALAQNKAGIQQANNTFTAADALGQNPEAIANLEKTRQAAAQYIASHFGAPSEEANNLYTIDPNTGMTISQPNRFRYNMMEEFDNPVKNAFSGAGVKKLGVPNIGPYQQSQVPQMRSSAVTTPQTPVHPEDSKKEFITPKPTPEVKQTFEMFNDVVRNYTKDMSMHEASKVRDRVQEAVAEETMNKLGLSPASIGSSIFYQSAEKTLKEAAKDPAMAQRIHSISAEEHATILQEALRKAGILQ